MDAIEKLGERIVQDINMVKEGDTAIHLSFRRSMSGLTLSVKTIPAVEEFFRNLSTGDHADVRGLGRYWAPLTKDTPLMAYNLSEPIPIFQLDSHRQARFDWLAKPLLTNAVNGDRLDAPAMPGQRPMDINLAFLRLIGIGDGGGVTFRIAGVFSDSACQSMRDQVSDACREFYKKYMKPLNMEGAIILEPVVLTQDWRP